MRCPNCNSRIENEADICRYCNYDITGKKNNTHNEQYEYSLKFSNTNDDLTTEHDGQYEYSSRYSKFNKQDSSKEKLQNAYIGKNKDIIDSKFNIFALIFGPFYLFYRNLNKLGILVLLFYLIFINEPLVLILINVLLGFEFKKYFYNDMDNKIKKILKNNQDKSNTEIIELIKAKGNTNNSIKIFILLLGILLVLTVILYMYNKNNIKQNENKYLLRVSFDKLNYKIPNKYKLLSNLDNYKAYDNSTNNHNCIFSISSKEYKYYKDEISYIKTTDKPNTIKKQNINNNTWYYYKKDNKDIYVIKKDNYFYKVIFNTYIDNDGICLDSKNDFINSLKFEEV